MDYQYNRAKASVFQEIIRLLTPEALQTQIAQIKKYQLDKEAKDIANQYAGTN